MPPFCLRGPHNMAEAPENNNLNLAPLPGAGNGGLLAQAFPLENSLPQLLMSQSGVAGEDELMTRRSLRLRVVARDMSLQRLSIYTPALVELDLSGSCLTSLRDLGCNLRLETLSVVRCGLTCLDGASGLACLKQLNAAHNSIADIGPCAMLPRIQRIDLTDNAVCDLSQVGFLSLCAELRHLTLTGCPLQHVANYQQHVANYRQHVVDLLPELITLDGQPLPVDGQRSNERGNEGRENGEEEEEEEEKEEGDSDVDTESKAIDDERETEKEKGELVKMKFTKKLDTKLPSHRPSTSTGIRRSSLLSDKQLIGNKDRKSRPQSAGLTDTGVRRRGNGEVDEDKREGREEAGETSRLTSGVIVCGNLTAALKKRNRKQRNAWTSQPVENNVGLNEFDEAAAEERSKDVETLLTASKKWRSAFAQYRELNGEKWKTQELDECDSQPKDSKK